MLTEHPPLLWLKRGLTLTPTQRLLPWWQCSTKGLTRGADAERNIKLSSSFPSLWWGVWSSVFVSLLYFSPWLYKIAAAGSDSIVQPGHCWTNQSCVKWPGFIRCRFALQGLHFTHGAADPGGFCCEIHANACWDTYRLHNKELVAKESKPSREQWDLLAGAGVMKSGGFYSSPKDKNSVTSHLTILNKWEFTTKLQCKGSTVPPVLGFPPDQVLPGTARSQGTSSMLIMFKCVTCHLDCTQGAVFYVGYWICWLCFLNVLNPA